MTPRPYRVVARRREVADTLTPAREPCGEPIPGVRPGRFTLPYVFGAGKGAELGQPVRHARLIDLRDGAGLAVVVDAVRAEPAEPGRAHEVAALDGTRRLVTGRD